MNDVVLPFKPRAVTTKTSEVWKKYVTLLFNPFKPRETTTKIGNMNSTEVCCFTLQNKGISNI